MATKKKSGKEKAKSANQNLEMAFFIMPSEGLKNLREELEFMFGKDMTKGVLFRFGFKSGESLAKKLGLPFTSDAELPQLLDEIWQEIGVGKIKVSDSSGEKIVVEFIESIEADVLGATGKPSCDFTRGYLAGTLSGLTNRKYYSNEDMCIAAGDKYCRHTLSLKVLK